MGFVNAAMAGMYNAAKLLPHARDPAINYFYLASGTILTGRHRTAAGGINAGYRTGRGDISFQSA